MNRRRLAIVIGLLCIIALAIGLRSLSPPPLPVSVPLSSGKYRVRFLKADAGTLKYSSDSALRKLFRPWLPNVLAARLGLGFDVNFTASKESYGGLPLALLFQLTTPADGVQGTTETAFSRMEFPESTGFLFVEPIGGYTSTGNGTSLHGIGAFPRRDPNLTFRVYETNGSLLMERTIPNPGYQSRFPEWAPEPLPSRKQSGDFSVTLNSLAVHSRSRWVQPILAVTSADNAWTEPVVSHRWSDATGNCGGWLSPFEPAWKLHLTLRRRRDAAFGPRETWVVPMTPIPAGLTLTKVDQESLLDGHRMSVPYVAPAGAIHDDGGVITITPSQSLGHPGLGISSGSSMVNGRSVTKTTLECGLPFVRLDHGPLPPDVELLCDVRDQDGVLLNEGLQPSQGGLGGSHFHAVTFRPRPETTAVQLTVRFNAPRQIEFVVAPPEEMRKSAGAAVSQ